MNPFEPISRAPSHPLADRAGLRLLAQGGWALACALGLSACVVAPLPPAPSVVQVAPPVAYVPPPPAPVVSVYVEPPLVQPEPIAVAWAPPPMLVEAPPPLPFAGAIWIGGYWVWEGNWVWAAGRWAPPPQPGYGWVHPYYEHRGNLVVFVTGHWSPPGVVFVPPPPNLSLTVVVAGPGVHPGPAPMGPQGVFVPPPPGSRPGLVVPAPVGTPPAVVVSAAPVTNVGMHIQANVGNTSVTNVTNISNVTNITHLTIVAPPSATASGQAFQSSVPAQAHLAAALPAMVHAQAPVPISAQAIPSFAPNRPPAALPAPQAVHAAVTPAWQAHLNPHANNAAPPAPPAPPAPAPVHAGPGAVPQGEAHVHEHEAGLPARPAAEPAARVAPVAPAEPAAPRPQNPHPQPPAAAQVPHPVPHPVPAAHAEAHKSEPAHPAKEAPAHEHHEDREREPR